MRRRTFLTHTASLAGMGLLATRSSPAAAGGPATGADIDVGPGAGSRVVSATAPHAIPAAQSARAIKPRRLRPGDTVGVVTPATATFQQVELDIVRESLEGLGLKVRIGEHVMNRYGSLGGQDRDRADDMNRFFRDPEVRAVLPTRGGWGSARLLPLLDYDAFRRDPKIVLGYSDITALLNGLHAKTGVVTFHGPNGGGRWDEYSLDFTRRVLFDGEAVTFTNPKTTNDRNVLTQIDDRIRVITPGSARGRLIGGNLSVLTTIAGSPYVPSLDGAVLFTEDVDERYYRIDRMMTQLALSGWFTRLAGFVFGTCSECSPGDGYASFTLEEVLNDHIHPLGVPAWQGAMIGHAMSQWTLPIGLDVDIDAAAGSIRMVEPAVI
ncbi:MAG: LD-carboxypeptidase [Vicinamibacterales bacterium]